MKTAIQNTTDGRGISPNFVNSVLDDIMPANLPANLPLREKWFGIYTAENDAARSTWRRSFKARMDKMTDAERQQFSKFEIEMLENMTKRDQRLLELVENRDSALKEDKEKKEGKEFIF